MSKHHSGKDYLNEAKKCGCTVQNGKGDHFKVRAPDGAIIIVPLSRELATGTECVIRKWFRQHLGLVLAAFTFGIAATLTLAVMP